MFKPLSQWFSEIVILPPGGHLQYLGAVLVVTTKGVGVAGGISWLEAWDAAKHLAVHKTMYLHPSSHNRIIWSKMSALLRLRNPALS